MLTWSGISPAALCKKSQCADLSTASPTDCPKSSLKFENSPTTKNRHTLAVYAHFPGSCHGTRHFEGFVNTSTSGRIYSRLVVRRGFRDSNPVGHPIANRQ